MPGPRRFAMAVKVCQLPREGALKLLIRGELSWIPLIQAQLFAGKQVFALVDGVFHCVAEVLVYGGGPFASLPEVYCAVCACRIEKSVLTYNQTRSCRLCVAAAPKWGNGKPPVTAVFTLPRLSQVISKSDGQHQKGKKLYPTYHTRHPSQEK